MTINLTINLDAAIRWEKMTSKPFTSLDYSDEDDLMRLCYCATIAADPTIDTPFDTYRKTFETSDKVSKATMQAIRRLNIFMSQFQPVKLDKAVKIDEITDEPERMERVASYLIVAGGMDAHYVLHDMPLEYIQMFVEGVADRTRQRMENDRFWTWLLLKPHDAKNAYPNPKRLLTFPWEREENVSKAATEAKTLRDTAGEFASKLNSAKWNK